MAEQLNVYQRLAEVRKKVSYFINCQIKLDNSSLHM